MDDDFMSPAKSQFLDFDEFIDVMKERISVEKNNLQDDDCDIAFESHSSNVS